MIKLIDILKESSLRYKIIFKDYNYEDFPVNQVFNSEKEAEDWVREYEWEEDYETIDSYGEDIILTRTRYYNPEDKDNYFGYEIIPIKGMNESTSSDIMKHHAQKISDKIESIKKKIQDRRYEK